MVIYACSTSFIVRVMYADNIHFYIADLCTVDHTADLLSTWILMYYVDLLSTICCSLPMFTRWGRSPLRL